MAKGRPPIVPRIAELECLVLSLSERIDTLHTVQSEMARALEALGKIVQIVTNNIPVEDAYQPRFERWVGN
jgi:hypothetical protein